MILCINFFENIEHPELPIDISFFENFTSFRKENYNRIKEYTQWTDEQMKEFVSFSIDENQSKELGQKVYSYSLEKFGSFIFFKVNGESLEVLN
jgi:hypothetical protein